MKTAPMIMAERNDYCEREPSRVYNQTTGELVGKLAVGGVVVASLVIDHYVISSYDPVSKTALTTLGVEAGAFVASYLGMVFSRKTSRHSEGLETKVFMN